MDLFIHQDQEDPLEMEEEEAVKWRTRLESCKIC